MSSPIVLVHSPVVGGSFWEPVAQELTRRGFRACAPAPQRPDAIVPWRQWPERVSAELPPLAEAILVGHSAAGLLLPAIAERVRVRSFVFVDANIPPESGTAPPMGPEFMRLIRALPLQNGRLPRWSNWWPEAAMNALMPDPAARRRFDSDLPELSPEWFDDEVEVPAWTERPAGYVQTSERLSAEAERARALNWPMRVIDGSHLHPILAREATTDAILDVAGLAARTRA